MILTAQELREVYEGLVLPFGHPDPIGYMTRAYLLSGGDTDYFGGDGKVGFMPVEPERAAVMIGVQDVASLQNNVAATVTMDMMYFQMYQDIDNMIVAFHFGEQAVDEVTGTYTGDIKSFLEEIDDARGIMREIVSPRRATVNDVLVMLRDYMTKKEKPSKLLLEVVEGILEER